MLAGKTQETFVLRKELMVYNFGKLYPVMPSWAPTGLKVGSPMWVSPAKAQLKPIKI